MSQTMTVMARLLGSSQVVLEGSIQVSGSTRLSTSSSNRVTVARPGISVKAQQLSFQTETETSRRAVLGLVAAGLSVGSFAKDVLAAANSIKIGPPPPPSGGLPGTDNSDEARDLDKPLKQRFYLQPLPPTEAAARVKDSAKDIINVKELIDKKAWPYVQNDLRSKAEYLRYDLNTVISAKPKDEKKLLKELTGKLFQVINELDYAAKTKSAPKAEKAYAETVVALNDVLAKLG